LVAAKTKHRPCTFHSRRISWGGQRKTSYLMA
jgi:hypothetical protein